jgi:hypothetical protein
MSSVQPIAFLDAVSGYVRSSTDASSARPIRLAVVDPAYVTFGGLYPSGTNPARVTFEGETTLSAKAYPVASGYMPQAGDRVYMVPIGNTYLIVGSVSNGAAQGFYAKSGGDIGVELGGGSYFDTDSGLSLETDAYVAGDLMVDGVGAQLYRQATAVGPSAVSNTTTWYTQPSLYLDLSIGVWDVRANIAYTGKGGSIVTRWGFTGAYTGGKWCQGLSPYTSGTVTLNLANRREAAPFRSGVHGFTTGIQYGTFDVSNSAAAVETGLVTVTTPGRWSIEYTQLTSSTDVTRMEAISYMTARRVG